MGSQVVPAAKRYRISLLLDAYGELLTEKQRTFIRHYYEEDLSFGEIAREYNVSRQAIFDSVKHGEESLENFEKVLGLVHNGWAQWVGCELTPDAALEGLRSLRNRIQSGQGNPEVLVAEIDAMLRSLEGRDARAGQRDSEQDEEAELEAGGEAGAEIPQAAALEPQA